MGGAGSDCTWGGDERHHRVLCTVSPSPSLPGSLHFRVIQRRGGGGPSSAPAFPASAPSPLGSKHITHGILIELSCADHSSDCTVNLTVLRSIITTSSPAAIQQFASLQRITCTHAYSEVGFPESIACRTVAFNNVTSIALGI